MSVVLDRFPDSVQQSFNALQRWFDEQFAVVLAYILSEEVESIVDMCDVGLLVRQFQASFAQELFDERFDLVLK